MNDNELKIKVSNRHERKGLFKLVPASKLSLGDDFLKYQPKTKREQKFKELVETAIKRGLKDFWRPVCDPSFNDAGRICYEPGKKPAVGKSYNWWEKNAKDFCPERGSRLGTKSEYIAFLAVLIKELVASGKSIEWAWNAVCNDSKELGHYSNSKDAKHRLELTGNREICGFFDLANIYKLLAEDEEDETGGYWVAGGCYYDYYDSHQRPLVHGGLDHFCYAEWQYACGWLVLDSCPNC